MSRRITRREMLGRTALAGAGLALAPAVQIGAASPNEKLDVAVIGVGGRGRANLDEIAHLGENIVALCDVDDKRAGDAFEKFSKARRFRDFRKLFDAMENEIDAVVVSTPDHTHFHPAHRALEAGKHLYSEKPMAHSIWEVRTLTDLARVKGVATQLGVQRHVLDNVHRVVELVRGGAIGTVAECHAWVGGNRGMPDVPKSSQPVPEHLDWDLWIGPAEERPYDETYCPYGWRFWWDYGTGETGNWGCHVLDIPFWALELDYPTRVEGSGPPVDPERSPKSMTTRFVFPAKKSRSEVVLHWYHSEDGPAILREKDLPHFGTGVLFVGSEGLLLCEFNKRKLFPEAKFADLEPPATTLPDSPGFHREWTDACRGGEPATCRFDYSGPLTETVLLGNVAYRAAGSFDWDAKSLKADGNAKAQELIRTPFRKGWEIG